MQTCVVFFVSKCEGWTLDFSRTLVGFYLDPMREINSKGSHPQVTSIALGSENDPRGSDP